MSYYILTSVQNSKIYENISFLLSNNNSEENNNVVESYVSHSLFDFLSKFKKQIEVSSESWDNIKKYTNPYEFIHTIIPGNKTSISKLKPLSRSFYKMIELWKLFKLGEFKDTVNNFKPFLEPYIDISSDTLTDTYIDVTTDKSGDTNINMNKNDFLNSTQTKNISSFHLAEGPGGFIEAISHLRKNPNDTYYGMTLVNDDPGCPGWKKSNTFLEKNPNVHIISGSDGTGDLLKIENYKFCKERFLNSMDIITADGGIDVSTDFNKQEQLVSKLLISEIIYGITMQKKGGNFILKIFDIFSKLTVDILYLLSCIYSEVYVTKPYTSRLANSEKYIVCKNFLLKDSIKISEVFLNEFYKLNSNNNIISIVNIQHDYYFLNKIEEINVVLGQRQLENIITTLNMTTNKNNYDKIDTMKKSNIQKSISWCEKHDIPCIKLFCANNIFLSNTYEDGTPISTPRNHNPFLKKKSSVCTNNPTNIIQADNIKIDTNNDNKVNIEN
jgi:23S rRNA U2552 (ribose-2'-O)-methylase RlmE/FtsJ